MKHDFSHGKRVVIEFINLTDGNVSYCKLSKCRHPGIDALEKDWGLNNLEVGFLKWDELPRSCKKEIAL